MLHPIIQDNESVTSHTNTVHSNFTAANLQRAMQLVTEQNGTGTGAAGYGSGKGTGGTYSTTFGTTASGYEGGGGNDNGGGGGGSIMLR